MKIFISASKSAYEHVQAVINALENHGHMVTPPNGYDSPDRETTTKIVAADAYAKWKSEMIKEDGRIIAAHDAILVLNFEKNNTPDYIGGATFLEMFKAFDLGKKIYLYNPIPDNQFRDEIIGLLPIIINQDLSLIT